VSCTGTAFVGRVAASLLHAVGLPELAVDDMAGYEALARGLATDPRRLAEVRERLRRARDTAPLFDSARTAGELDALYLRMAERSRAGLRPAALPPLRAKGAATGEDPGR
jgi:predicted O-linked N-acetylglucosamine transferase (SPINDLY family)